MGTSHSGQHPVAVKTSTVSAKTSTVAAKTSTVAAKTSVKEVAEAPVSKKSQAKVSTAAKSEVETPKVSITADIILSHASSDAEFVTNLKTELLQRLEGISIEMDDGDQDKNISLVDCKIFIPVLSKDGCISRITDQIALAYVSNRPIIPLNLEPLDVLGKTLNYGSKLTLKNYQWIAYPDTNQFTESTNALTDHINQLTSITAEDTQAVPETDPEESIVPKHQPVNKLTRAQYRMKSKSSTEADKFWERNIGDEESVSYEQFKDVFLKDYSKEFKDILDDSQLHWLVELLQKELFTSKDVATKEEYLGFVGKDEHFLERVTELACEKLAMINVFSMQSSVRLQAIQNLVKFSSPAVVQSLIELLQEEDANVRAVACLTLGKLGSGGEVELPDKVPDIIISLLYDKDRLVREAACVTLGRLRVVRAVHNLIHLWRNDFIFNVREAASNALKKMHDEDADRAVLLTQVLQNEVKALGEET